MFKRLTYDGKKDRNKKVPITQPCSETQVDDFRLIPHDYIKIRATDKEIKEASVENTMDAEARSVSLFIWDDRI